MFSPFKVRSPFFRVAAIAVAAAWLPTAGITAAVASEHASAQAFAAKDPAYKDFKARSKTQRSQSNTKLELGLDFLRHQVPQNIETARGDVRVAKSFGRLDAASWAKDVERDSGLRMVGDAVIVEAIVENPTAAAKQFAALGMTRIATAGGMVAGILPAANLSRAEKIYGLRRLRPAVAPVKSIGVTTSGGDEALGTDIARNQFGVDGTGFKIGILSDSFDWRDDLFGDDTATLGGIASGDLPGPGNPNGYTTPVTILEEPGARQSDEGRAMAEIIHDIAPGAELGFATATISQAGYAQNIRRLADPSDFDADILVDDIFYTFQPFFQDGVIAQAVEEVVADGKIYVTAAGNEADMSYESGFRPSVTPISLSEFGFFPTDYILHDYDPGPGVDYFQEIIIDPFESINITLQWDDPFASACAGCPGADTDVDLLVLAEEDPDTVLGASFDDNLGADPVEGIGFRNGGTEPVTLYLAIGRFFDAQAPLPNPKRVKWVDSGRANIEVEWDTQSSTIVGHRAAEGAVTVGAAFYQTAGPGQTPQIEGFSSRGGSKILFKPDGSPTFQYRFKPNVVGPDGVNTTFFGFFDAESDGFPNFFGTSAAAPHIAALGALIGEASFFPLDPFIFGFVLEVTAIDMDDPLTPGFDPGFDDVTGYGFVDGQAAIDLLSFP